MRVCKHGCGVKLFGFSRANHASTNLKKSSSSKLKKLTLFTHYSRRWENSRQLCKPETKSRVCITVVFISGYANTENVFYCLTDTLCQERPI